MALYMHDLDVRRDALEEGRTEGRAEGRAEGREQEKESNIARMAEYIMEMFPGTDRPEAERIAAEKLG